MISSEAEGTATGFPLVKNRNKDLTLVGHIGLEELAVGLGRLETLPTDTPVSFSHAIAPTPFSMPRSAVATPGLTEVGGLCDRAPLTVSTRSPLHVWLNL